MVQLVVSRNSFVYVGFSVLSGVVRVFSLRVCLAGVSVCMVGERRRLVLCRRETRCLGGAGRRKGGDAREPEAATAPGVS